MFEERNKMLQPQRYDLAVNGSPNITKLRIPKDSLILSPIQVHHGKPTVTYLVDFSKPLEDFYFAYWRDGEDVQTDYNARYAGTAILRQGKDVRHYFEIDIPQTVKGES